MRLGYGITLHKILATSPHGRTLEAAGSLELHNIDCYNFSPHFECDTFDCYGDYDQCIVNSITAQRDWLIEGDGSSSKELTN